MSVAHLIVGRILSSLLTLLLVSILIFVVLELLPGDVASRVLGRDATQEALALLRTRLRLEDPALTRYLGWLGGLLSGDWGTSLVSGRSVGEILAPRIVNTLLLSAYAFLLYGIVAFIPAMVQALFRDRLVDQAISVASLVILSIPEFLLGTLFIIAFVIAIPAFPAVSIVNESMSFWEYVRALTLPALTLALAMSVHAMRMLRDNLIDVLGSDYIRMAALKGVPAWRIAWRHALPNALVPTLNVSALNVAYLIGGVVVVEKVFGFPGFGSLMVNALQLRDLPLIEATVMVAAAIYIAANLAADVGTILINPRLRVS